MQVVANILSKGTKLREYTKGVENNLRQVELDSIQDYIKESDNLVSLHDQIRDCDSILFTDGNTSQWISGRHADYICWQPSTY
ncbi:Vacuolar protein sorting-associated protein 52 A [Vitis vinifera]|uniref:Vacuolar protein sorting-associated protein 52 A n=1 Tax=Vitis vinifera TaxID=29760 RepID=A0A438J1B7_VITVI|nr:Vacuolar protein sorting-associated protein 52 A [Vitis vinifera]